MCLTGETACATTCDNTNHRPPCSKTHGKQEAFESTLIYFEYVKYRLILFVWRMNRRTIPIRCDTKSNERRRRGEVGSTEDLGDIETWLMPALSPLGSSPVGRVSGRPGRPARTYTHRPRTHICMLFRQDTHARNIHAHFRGLQNGEMR